MKKRKLVIVFVLLFLGLFLVPIPRKYKDGGTVEFQALLYQVTKYHQLDMAYEDGYKDGMEVKILGNRVYYEMEEPIEEVSQEEPKRVIMVHDQFFYDTGKESSIVGRCGVMDGKIVSHVSASELPTKNNEANFEGDYEYQVVDANTIELLIDNHWIVFKTLDSDF